MKLADAINGLKVGLEDEKRKEIDAKFGLLKPSREERLCLKDRRNETILKIKTTVLTLLETLKNGHILPTGQWYAPSAVKMIH